MSNGSIANSSLVSLAKEINATHGKATECAASALKYAWRCGQLLLEAKGQLQHGQWLAICQATSGLTRHEITERTGIPLPTVCPREIPVRRVEKSKTRKEAACG